MKLVKLGPKDWKKFRDLRLEALREDSLAFGASYEEKAKQPDEKWKQKLENPKNPIMVAYDGRQLIGMVAAYQEKGEKLKHIAYVWGVYLRKDYRGKGIGKRLMEALLDEIAKNKEIEKLNLNVNANQQSAVKLYEKLGFRKMKTGMAKFTKNESMQERGFTE